MTKAHDSSRFDYAALATRLLASDNLGQQQLVNDMLCDVRGWRNLEPAEVARRLAADPLAAVAALELTDAAPFLNEFSLSETDFLRPFTSREFLRYLIYLPLDSAPAGLPEFKRLAVCLRRGPWEALAFLHLALRWATRFADWQPNDLRDLMRINLQHPFITVVVDPAAPPVEQLLNRAFQQLGIRTIELAASVPEHHLAAWLAEALNIGAGAKAARQQRLDFREAGGTRNSMFVVRAMGGVDGCEVRGSLGDDLGLIIDIGDREVSRAATVYLEQYAVRVINEQTELSAKLTDHNILLRWYNTSLQPEDLGRIIYQALKEQLVLSTISVNLLFDPIRIASLRPSIFAYRDERLKDLQRRDEEHEAFILCRSCASYSPNAFCVVSVDRSPGCHRTYDELAALAQFTNSAEQVAIDHGVCQDRVRGRYMGVEKIARHFSRRPACRINLHSIRDFPHPTTALAECIAWYQDELDAICVISADYPGRSPDGKTYNSLLARVAGRQTPGYVGVSEEYLRSPRFAAAEGGMSRVGWMNSTLKHRLGIRAEHIATEKDCINMAGLKEYLATWRH